MFERIDPTKCDLIVSGLSKKGEFSSAVAPRLMRVGGVRPVFGDGQVSVGGVSMAVRGVVLLLLTCVHVSSQGQDKYGGKYSYLILLQM